MIRYVLAAILTVAIFGLALSAIDYGAGINGERQVESQIAAIDESATSLVANEELPPPGQPGSQRVQTVTFPADSLTSTPVERFHLERADENTSVVTYRVEGRTDRVAHIDVPIVQQSGEPIEFGGSDTETTIRLVLERDPDPDSDRPIVVLERV